MPGEIKYFIIRLTEVAKLRHEFKLAGMAGKRGHS
jgi:hypothetical protein